MNENQALNFINTVNIKLKRAGRVAVPIIALIVTIFFVFIAIATKGESPAIFLAAGVAFIIAVGTGIYAIFTFKREKFKREKMGGIINEVFPNCIYEPDKFLTMAEYSAMEMLRMGNHYEGSDLLTGTTSTGTPFRYCEIDTYDVRRDSEGKSSKTRVFKGGIFTFDYPKHFDYKIVASPRGVMKGQGFGKKWFENYKKVETESIEFNKAFTVYSNNMEEVFYIFTPQVMERFITLNNKYKKGIIFGLKDGKINLAIPGLNMFEPPSTGLQNPAKLEELKQKVNNQLNEFLVIEQLLQLEPRSTSVQQEVQATNSQQSSVSEGTLAQQNSVPEQLQPTNSSPATTPFNIQQN